MDIIRTSWNTEIDNNIIKHTTALINCKILTHKKCHFTTTEKKNKNKNRRFFMIIGVNYHKKGNLKQLEFAGGRPQCFCL